MKSLVRVALAGVVVVAILAAVLLLLPQYAVTQPTDIVFASGAATDVESVSVRNAYGSFRFFYDDKEGGYVLDDIPAFIADLDEFFDFMLRSASLSAIRRITLEISDISEWGLDQPSADVEILFFDGKTLKLQIGDIERISGNYYALVEGFDEVYIIPRATAEQFLRPKTQIISRYVTPPLAVSSPLSAIRDIVFTGGGLDHPVAIHATTGGSLDNTLAALSFGGATHIVRGAATYQLDQTYGVGILGSLFGIIAIDIVGYDLSEAEVAAYGFDRPYMAVVYDMINGVNAEVRRMHLLVAQAESGLYYITQEGSGVVYIIGREAFLDIQYDKLPVRWFLTPFIMDLTAVTVAAPGAGYRFDIDNTDSRNPVVTYNGQVLDTTLFRAFFRLITSAAHDGEYLGAHASPLPGEEAVLSITYEYRNTDKSPDVLTLYPGGVRRHNVFVNGAGEFAIKDLFSQRVLEGCVNLINGNAIEEEW